MRDLFAPGGLIALEALSFTRCLYAFDFDGTLARIVRDPEDARMTDETERLFGILAGLAPTAIISGRGLEDLRRRLKHPPPYLIGNHGLEGLPSRMSPLARADSVCAGWLEQIDREHAAALAALGAEVEDKSFSLALHYRKSRNKGAAKELIARIVASLSPAARVIPGKCVSNLIPMGAPHKGIALMELMADLGVKASFYIGDDDTDEDAFALPEARLSRILTVRVGAKKSTFANYSISKQSDINRLLRAIISFETRSRGPSGPARKGTA